MAGFKIGRKSSGKTNPNSGGSFLPRHLRKQNPSESAPSRPRDSFVPNGKKPEETSKVKAPTAQKLSLDNLTGAREIALNALPAPAAVALRKVWNRVGVQTQEQLVKLLEKGTLQKEEAGTTVVENLLNLTEKERVAGLDGRQLTDQTVDLLANSKAYQGDRFSCGAASLQVKMSEDNPALLTHIIEDLTDQDGQTAFRGASLTLQPNSIGDDGSGRNALDRTVQSALMDYAGRARGQYDVLTDLFDGDPDKGLKDIEVARLAAAADGEAKAVLHHNSYTYKVFRPMLKATPEGTRVLVGVSWNEQDHILTYLGQQDGQAKYYDTQTGQAGEMSMDDFLFKVQFAVFPETQLDGADVPPEYVKRTSALASQNTNDT